MRSLLIFLLLGACASAAANQNELLPLPAGIQDGDVVNLECGRTYVGALNLVGLRDVTVQTLGECGRASLTPAVAVGGWRRDKRQPSIWVADIGFAPVQLQLGKRFAALAHYPNAEGSWLRGVSRVADQLRVSVPSADLAGATLVWRAADWMIETRAIHRYDGQTVYLAPGANGSFGLLAETDFYIEGKRWMLDAPGEWLYDDGKLYIWPHDGRSPQGRAWASPAASAIDARDSRDVRIKDVSIFAAALGIDGSGSRGLQVSDATIENSGEAALMAGSEMRVLRVVVRGAVKDGLRATDAARDVQVLDSRFEDIGMLGMPRRSRGAIVFEQAQRVIIQRNRIRNASYLGIRVFRDALVSGNEIVRACQRLDDCAGIYTFARDRLPLHVTLENNRISRLGGKSAFAIYLDDFANGVRVTGNEMVDNPGGMQLHNGFNNEIVGNLFANSQWQHLLFNETADYPAIVGNRISRNRFVSTGEVPVFRLWSHHGGKHVGRFAEFRANRYRAVPQHFAEIEGRGPLALSQWLMSFGDGDGDDTGGQKNAGPAAPASAHAGTASGSGGAADAAQSPSGLARRPAP